MPPNLCRVCGEGLIEQYVFQPTGESLLACDECDAVWPPRSDLSLEPNETLDGFFEDRGFPLASWPLLVRAEQTL